MESQRQADSAVQAGVAEELPLDLSSATALLRQLYPRKQPGSASAISELVEELALIGVTSVGHLRELLENKSGIPDEVERTHTIVATDGKGSLADVGAARATLRKIVPGYAAVFDERAERRRKPVTDENGAGQTSNRNESA